MSIFVSTLIVISIITLPYWASTRAVKRLEALKKKGQVYFVCGHIVEFNPYMPRIDRLNIMRDARILNLDVRVWDSKCASV